MVFSNPPLIGGRVYTSLSKDLGVLVFERRVWQKPFLCQLPYSGNGQFVLYAENVIVKAWPEYIPDFNPKKNLWKILVQKVSDLELSNVDHLLKKQTYKRNKTSLEQCGNVGDVLSTAMCTIHSFRKIVSKFLVNTFFY